MTRPLALPPLYPIVDVRSDSSDALERAVAFATLVAEAGASLIQLRMKPLAAGAATELAARVVEAIVPHRSRLIVNDRADVAAASGAAGVHVGGEDVPPRVARECVGPDAIVGYSTHSLADVRAAVAYPIDYVGFGPIFDSPTKAGARTPRGIDALAAACAASTVPVVAIGGVTLATAPALWRAGAASVAVISELERAADPANLARAYLSAARENRDSPYFSGVCFPERKPTAGK